MEAQRLPSSLVSTPLESPAELQARIHAERRGTPFLVYRDGAGNQILLDLSCQPERITIGRRPGNEVTLDWDAEVSRVHATLCCLGGNDWIVNDDGLSHNGTWVNGERVTGDRRLRDGDTITIGATAISFRSPGATSQSMPTMTAAGPHPAARLSPAQRRVLLALCRPFKDSAYAAPASNQRIADELVVGTDAVKTTMRALFEVFGVEDLPQNQKRAALAQRALQSGAVSRRDL
jgi:pSer/pThr/pTyr-binding forkhead associated (FHA) protein